jgi:colanic acid/amylovoran biosynthesis glycosyltransferase
MNRSVVAHSVNPYCPASWVYHQLTGLKRYRATVLCKRRTKIREFPFHPVYSQRDLPWPRRLYEKLYHQWSGNGFPTHRRALQQHQALLLHSHFSPTGMSNWKLARSLQLPHLTTFYGVDIWAHCRRPGWQERFRQFAAHSDLFLVEGGAMRNKVISLGAAEDRTEIFRLGLDLSKIPFTPRRPVAGDKIRILMCGRAYEKKGHIDGLRAFAQLAPRYPQLHLDMIIGGSSAKAEKCAAALRQFIASSQLGPRITWSEMLPYDQYLQRLSEAHIFLQPSVMAADGDAEGGFPVTLIELSAAGVPIVATRHCDIPEAVLHERTGLLAEEHDVPALSAHLERLIQQPELWLDYGQAGREHVEKNYNIRTQIDWLENTYDKLLIAKQSAPAPALSA